MVIIYYELCESVWGGSPATTQIDYGIRIISQDDLASQVAPVSQVLPASQDDVNPDSQIGPASSQHHSLRLVLSLYRMNQLLSLLALVEALEESSSEETRN